MGQKSTEAPVLDRIERFFKGDVRAAMLVFSLIFVIAVVFPIGLKTGVDGPTRAYYNYIQSIPDGGVVGWEITSAFMWGGSAEAYLTTWKHILSRPIKLVAVSFDLTGPAGWRSMIEYLKPEQYGKKYGLDFVYLGYLAGEQAAIRSWKLDMQTAFPTDFYGTPIKDIPMMKNIRSWKDLNLMIAMPSSTTGQLWWIREWYGDKLLDKVPLVVCMSDIAWKPDIDHPYAFLAGLHGVEGAWMYEELTREGGWGGEYRDGIALASLGMIVYMIIVNIGVFYGRIKVQRTEEVKR